MRVGNRRLVGSAVAALSATLILAGCAGTSVLSSDVGVAIGRQALDFTSPAAESQGWTSTQQCTSTLQQSIESGASNGVTLSPVDPQSVSGPLTDPSLNTGDVATCAFTAVSGTRQQVQEFFVGMPKAYFAVYAQRLGAAGFTAGAETVPANTAITEQIFTKDSDRVVLLYNPTTPGLLAVFG